MAQATLGVTKSGEGLNAVNLYDQGRMEELKKYCLNDVKLTKELYDFVRAHGKLMYRDRDGSVKEAKILPKVPTATPRGVNLTMPF